MKAYIQAKSKKSLNERLGYNEDIQVVVYDISGASSMSIHELPKGCVISVFEKFVGGSPYAKSYGVWDGTKVK